MSDLELSKATRLAARLQAYKLGHTLGPFRQDGVRERWVATCQRCGLRVICYVSEEEGRAVGCAVGGACVTECGK